MIFEKKMVRLTKNDIIFMFHTKRYVRIIMSYQFGNYYGNKNAFQ